jgi:shikimate dehydrogenase
MRCFGLIGFPLGHSFSKQYFNEKFEREAIADCRYELYPMESCQELPILLQKNPGLCGLNVTIPHKQSVISYLDELDETAQAIGAVNCIRIDRQGRKKGFNTDAIGFEQSLLRIANGRWAKPGTRAAVLGNGGAAKAVIFILKKLNIDYQVFTRSGEEFSVGQWPDLAHFSQIALWLNQAPNINALLINTTPLGMVPAIDTCPEVPFNLLNNNYLAYDLVYNPVETLFLQQAARAGAITENGLPMLYGQAEAAWHIWNS